MLEHGSFDMKIIEQTLVVRCFDAWNNETVLRMCKEYKDLVSNINNQKYEAVVCSSSVQKYLMEKSHDVLTNVEAKFYDELVQAYEWLESVGVYKI